MSFKNLPTEIYLHIFRYLPKKSLTECQTICKASQTAATQTLCQSVGFSDILAARIQKDQVKMGLWVKSLEIHIQLICFEPILDQKLTDLFRLMPHLRILTLYYGGSSEKLLTFLIGLMDVDKKYMSHLQEMVLSGYRHDALIKDLYLSNMHRLCDTIQRLKLRGLESPFYQQHGMRVFDYVSAFKNLKCLTIVPDHTIQQQENQFNVLSILLACPTLEKLDYETHQTLEALLLEDLSKPTHVLKDFRFKAQNLPPTYASFMMDFILPQVNTFELKLMDDTMYDALIGPYASLFAQGLKSITYLKLDSFFTDIRQSKNTSLLTTVWRFLGQIKSLHPSVCTTVDIRLSSLRPTDLKSLELDVRKNRLKAHVHMYVHRTMTCVPDLLASFKKANQPELMDCLYLYDSFPEFLPVELLKGILISCRRLQCLMIQSVAHKESTIHCYASKPFVFQPTDTSTKENIRYADLLHVALQDTLLSTLNEYLPNIEYLSMQDCQVYLDKHNNTVLDLHHLSRLKSIDLNPFNIETAKMKTLFFKLNMKDNASLVYKTAVKSQRSMETLQITTDKYLHGYHRLTSVYTTLITIVCHQVDKVVFTTKSRYVPKFEFIFTPWHDYLTVVSNDQQQS
ncbi:hypothetical protein CU098_002430 [Rhizopus stolonifer]|uniref:F-box domain-containing protein n=1 Tax=Rhizopus stolonifer TaxID=4846 RepID=A0A367J6S3_RHIST|nr:hypothetical protein CU098_002430 [Rhizopus stolonifer]